MIWAPLPLLCLAHQRRTQNCREREEGYHEESCWGSKLLHKKTARVRAHYAPHCLWTDTCEQFNLESKKTESKKMSDLQHSRESDAALHYLLWIWLWYKVYLRFNVHSNSLNSLNALTTSLCPTWKVTNEFKSPTYKFPSIKEIHSRNLCYPFYYQLDQQLQQTGPGVTSGHAGISTWLDKNVKHRMHSFTFGQAAQHWKLNRDLSSEPAAMVSELRVPGFRV